MSQEEFDAKILALRLERALIMEEQRKAREARLLAQQFRQSSDSRDLFLNRGLPEGKIITTKSDPTGMQSGFLFHRDQERVDDGRNSFLLRWGDRPLVPNWRRIEAVRGQPADLLIADDPMEGRFDPDDLTTLPEVDLSAVPRDSLSQATMYKKRAISWLDLGNALFLALNMPDSAAVWYRKVIEENPEELVVQRSYYALAEVQKTLGDSLSAVRINNLILDQFPDSEFADRIREQRGIQIEATEIDSSALALDLYDIVFNEWQSGRADDLINQTVLIAATFPGTDAGARALLAGGEYHLEKAEADRAKILAPILLQLPESILSGLWPEKYGIEVTDEAFPLDSTQMDPALPDSTQMDLTPPDSTQMNPALADSIQMDRTPPDSTQMNPAPADSTQMNPALADSTQMNPALPDSTQLDPVFVSTPDSRTTDPKALLVADTLGVDLASFESLRDEVEFDRLARDHPAPIYIVEDLLEVVIRDYARTSYATRATELRTAITELRNPPVSVPVIRDTESVQSDSLIADRENLAASTDSLRTLDVFASEDSTKSLRVQLNRSDSLVVEAAADSLPLLRANRPDSTALDLNTPIKHRVTRDVQSEANQEGENRPWVMLFKYPDITLDDEEVDIEFENFFESSTLKPLRIRRILDLSVVGWTVLLERVAGITTTRKKAGEYAELMDTEEQKVMILKDVDPNKTEMIIAWGIFASKIRTDEAVAGLTTSLPEGFKYILMTPLEDE